MSLDRAAIVAEARTWLGTKFRHQGRVKGVGVDCAGVAVGVAQVCGLDWTDVKGYPRVPANGQFQAAVESATDPIELADVQPGDLMTFRWRDEPQHIAIVSQLDPIRLIHAWEGIGRCVENDLDATWRARLVSCRRYRSGD